MVEQSQRKGIDEYRQKIMKQAEDEKIRNILRKYANKSVDVDQLLPLTLSVLADCLILEDYGINVPSKDILRELERVQNYASKLSQMVRGVYPDTAALLKTSALQDTNKDVEFLERGDPFAREDRLYEAATFISGLLKWAEAAHRAFKARKGGSPKATIPTYAGDRLARLYQRLTLRKPTRSSIHSREHPFGQIEQGEFGKFADELLTLVGMKLSDEAKKHAIAKLKNKGSSKSD